MPEITALSICVLTGIYDYPNLENRVKSMAQRMTGGKTEPYCTSHCVFGLYSSTR